MSNKGMLTVGTRCALHSKLRVIVQCKDLYLCQQRIADACLHAGLSAITINESTAMLRNIHRKYDCKTPAS
jgi:hypothetical protein